MGVALAASLPGLDYDCGLGTASLFTADVTTTPLRASAGALPTGRVTPDEGSLAAVAAPAERREWWLERLRRCHAILAAQA